MWPETLRFLASSGIDLSPLVTQRFAIDEALDALDAAHHPESTIKAHIELTALTLTSGGESRPDTCGPDGADRLTGMMRAASR